MIVDSLSVNNLKSLDNDNVNNKKLYASILNNRLDLLKENDIKLIIQDARDYIEVSKLYSNINPDVIIHLAAVSHSNKSTKTHILLLIIVRTLENTLDFARGSKNREFICY